MYIRGGQIRIYPTYGDDQGLQKRQSQAVRIPKEFQLDADEVEIFRQGEDLVLRPKKPSLADLLRTMSKASDDFFAEGRYDPLPEECEPLK